MALSAGRAGRNLGVAGLVIFLGTIALYLTGFRGVFIYDDLPQFVENARLHDVTRLHDVLFCMARQHRPIQNILLALDWTVSNGEPWSFHLTNALLHALCATLLFAYLSKVFSRSRFVPVVATALFILHPLQTQAVTYVMGRISLLECLFTLSCLTLYAYRGFESFAFLYALVALSPLAKESCVLIPVLLALHSWLLERRGLRQALSRRMLILFTAPLVSVPVHWLLRETISSNVGVVGFGLYPFWGYLLREGYYYLFHLFLLLDPGRQSLVHEYPVYSGALLALGILGWATYASALVLALRYRRKFPKAAFFTLFFIVALAPTNTIVQMINIFAEYRLYMPNLALFVALAAGLELALAKRWPLRQLSAAAVAALLVWFALCNLRQQRLWLDSAELLVSSVRNYPGSAELHNTLGTVYDHGGRYEEAAAEYREAIRLTPRSPENHRSYQPWFNLGIVYARLGRINEALKLIEPMKANFATGRPPLPYYQLYLYLLDKAGRRAELDRLKEEARSVYGADVFRQ